MAALHEENDQLRNQLDEVCRKLDKATNEVAAAFKDGPKKRKALTALNSCRDELKQPFRRPDDGDGDSGGSSSFDGSSGGGGGAGAGGTTASSSSSSSSSNDHDR